MFRRYAIYDLHSCAGQFGLYYWRAVLSGVAAQPVSDRVLSAAHVENGRVTSQHFETLAGLHELTPDLYPNRGGLGSCASTIVWCKVWTPLPVRAFPPLPPGAIANAASAPATPPSKWIAASRPISSWPLLSAPAKTAIVSLNMPSAAGCHRSCILLPRSQ